MSRGIKVNVGNGKVHLTLREWDGVGSPEYYTLTSHTPKEARWLAQLFMEAAAEAETDKGRKAEIGFLWDQRVY